MVVSTTAHNYAMPFLLAFCFYSCITKANDRYEDRIAEIDGVEYFYHDETHLGGSVLVRHSQRRAINIPDDRKRLCVPKSISGFGGTLPIVKIDIKAFRHLVDVEEIVLPDGIREIGGAAFEECWSLKKINIPSTVKIIEGGAFRDCESLKTLTLPTNVKIAPYELFKNCKSLEKFSFPNGEYESVGERCFLGCSSLKEIVIPPSVMKIGGSAFKGCSALSEIKMPQKLKTIENDAFSGCRSMKTIDIPESVIEIGDSAFKDCVGLRKLGG